MRSPIGNPLFKRPPAPQGPFETAGFTKILLSDATIAANGGEARLWPGLDVSKWDRLHFTVGADACGIPNLQVRVLFSVPVPGMHCGGILTSSTVWIEGVVSRSSSSTQRQPAAELGSP